MPVSRLLIQSRIHDRCDLSQSPEALWAEGWQGERQVYAMKEPALMPLKSQIPSCTNAANFSRPGKLRDHLAKKHSYQGKEIEEHLSVQRG